jgi:hypothetical protein
LFVIRQQHWNTVYTTKSERDVSWFETSPDVSLQMIEAAGLTHDACVIDVGGGDSRLVDLLIARGITCIAVLDAARAALLRAQARLGEKAFHFLTERADREHYKERLVEMLKPGGSAIIATFALDGPEKCSGLPIVRYSPATLASELGDRFVLEDSRGHVHTTPWGTTQAFQYLRFRKL